VRRLVNVAGANDFLTSRLRAATIMRMSGELQPAEQKLLPGQSAERISTGACPHCGHVPVPKQVTFRVAPFLLLIALARLVIAVGAALLLIALVASVVQWGAGRFASGEMWALFATFVLSIGVLLLYEIRDMLRQRQAAPRAETSRSAAPGVVAPIDDVTGAFWRSIGSLGSLVWLPFQSDDDRLLIGHLTFAEQRELLNRLAAVTVCMAGTTILPVVVAFLFMSPVAVCIAATLIASNLFVLDWFKKRHKKWIYSTEYARKHGITPPGE
jgi:hypothetical protein